MSGSSRVLYVGTAILIIAGVIFFGSILDANQCFPDRYWFNGSSSHQKNAKPQGALKNDVVDPVVLGDGRRTESQITCPYCAEAAKDSERYIKEQDLRAQQSMARSTYCSAIISIGQIFAGIVGLIFLALTLKFTRDTANAAVETSESAIRAFYAQHRPKIILRRAFSQVGDSLSSPIVVHYTLTNSGDSQCWITDAHIGIEFVSVAGYPAISLPPEQVFQNNVPHIGAFAAGETKECVFTDPTQKWDLDHRKKYVEPFGVYFVGHITYLDSPESNIRRQMGFRRRFNVDAQRFYRLAGTEDEYAD